MMWASCAIATATLALCSVFAVPLPDLPETAASDADITSNVYYPVDGEMDLTAGDVIINKYRNAIANANMKWPGGIIPYILSPLYSADVRTKIVAAMRELEQDVNNSTHACVRFTPRNAESNYIRIYPGSGCRAPIGMLSSGRQDVSLGRGCETKGVIMHELIHVLGFWHEHNRPDRDTYININLTNVLGSTQWDFREVAATMLNTLGTPYDLGSIMHYSPYTEAIDKEIPVITPKTGQADGIKLGQRMALSNWDVLRIQKWYGCTEDASHITRAYLTDSVARCDFASDTCGLTQDTTSTSRWTVQQGSSGAGPQAGNTNGVDAYLVAKEATSGTARIQTNSFDVGAICISFFIFQRGPSSYLNVVASGPRIARVVVATFQGQNGNEWKPVRAYINAPAGVSFQITFEAHVSSGDVAIDDVNIYKGQCS